MCYQEVVDLLVVWLQASPFVALPEFRVVPAKAAVLYTFSSCFTLEKLSKANCRSCWE